MLSEGDNTEVRGHETRESKTEKDVMLLAVIRNQNGQSGESRGLPACVCDDIFLKNLIITEETS